MRAASQPVFINEIHYDNTGTDVNEGIEIAGPAGTDLACYQICLYNGADSSYYLPPFFLSGIIDDEGCGYGALWFPISGIQNGPDGIALINACNCGGICDSTDVVQFLSYEGAFPAKDGPAKGMLSVNLGVSEPSSLAVGNSLQLSGSGVNYADFSWGAPSASSADSINTGQSFGGGIASYKLTFSDYPHICINKNDTFSLTVCGSDSAGNISNGYSGIITLTKISGPGNISGTLSLAAASCCARFTGLAADSSGAYLIVASDGAVLNDTLALNVSDSCRKCFEIASILAEACEPIPGTEGENEMVRFIVGSGNLDVNDLYITWPANPWLGICRNATTAAIVDSINGMITYGGSVSEPVNGILPAGATVILVTSSNFDWDSHDWKYLNYDIYMIFQCAGNTQGHFKNNEGCPCGNRTLIMTFAGACSDTVTYTVDSLPNGGNSGDGDMVIYDPQGNASYGNNLCLPPIFPFSLNLFMASQPVSCKSGCNGKASVFHTGGVKPYFYLWNDASAQTDSLATGLCAGTYTITVTDWLGTTAVDSVTVTEPDSLYATIASVTNVSCYGDSTGLATAASAGGTPPYSYLWNNGDNDSVAAAISSGNYTVTVTDSAGCTATATAIVTEPPQLIISTDSLKNVSCYGDSNGFVSVSVSGGTPGYTLLWSTGGSTSSIDQLTSSIYTVTVTDNNGCSLAAVISVSEPPSLSSVISGKTDVSCAGYCDGAATSTAGGGTLPYSFLWDNFEDSSSATGLCAGNHALTVTDANGCQVNSAVTITEPQPLQITLTATNVWCNGSCNGFITLLPGPTGGTPFYSYSWFPSVGNSATVINLCTGNFSVTVTDMNGCTVADSTDITEPLPMVLNTGSSDASCGSSNGMAWVTVTGSTPPYFFWWNDSLSQTNDTAFNLFAGSYKVVVADSNGCTDSASVAVNNSGAPVIQIDSVKTVTCFDDSDGGIFISLTGGNPPFTYSWSNLATTQDILNVVAGIYSVNVIDSLGCIAFAGAAIPSPSLLSLSVTGDTLLCYGQSAFLIANASGGINPYSYHWSNGLPDQQTQTVTPPITSQYFVYVTDISGCASDSDSIAVAVLPPLTGNAVSTGAGCPGDSVLLSAVATGGNGGPYTYMWLNNGNPNQTLWVNPLSDSLFAVFVMDDCSLTDTGSVLVNVYPNPQAQFAMNDSSGCAPLTVQFTNQSSVSSGFIASWQWDFGDGTGYSTFQSPSYTYTAVGVFTVTLAVTTDKGCTDSITETISSYPVPTADFYPYPQQTAINNPQIIFTDSSSIFVSVWSWDFGDGDTSDLKSPEHFYNDTGAFNVILAVKTAYGCYDSIMKPVRIFDAPALVDSTLNIPSSFSPNNDGINDTWIIRSIEYYPGAMVEIFNRWGSKIFTSSKGYPEPWDGTYGGKPVAAATYYFIMTFGDGKKPVTGTITVVR